MVLTVYVRDKAGELTARFREAAERWQTGKTGKYTTRETTREIREEIIEWHEQRSRFGHVEIEPYSPISNRLKQRAQLLLVVRSERLREP